MAERKAAKTTRPKASQTFTAEERAAMRETARERKRPSKDGEADILAKIAEMPKADRDKAKKVHAIVKDVAPGLAPRTWYGMPAYTKDGKLVCFFKAAAKFETRYATFGFEEAAHLDDGSMWPTSWALTKMTPADEAKIGELVKKAAS